MQGDYQEHQKEPAYPEDDQQFYEEDSYDYSNNQDYATDEYSEYGEKKGSLWGTVAMLLFLALVVGFIIGMLIFSSNSQSILP